MFVAILQFTIFAYAFESVVDGLDFYLKKITCIINSKQRNN
jgi:hypothetical protein